MSREMSYSPEQIEACILAYRNGDLNYCRAGIIDLLTAYAAALRQQSARVDELMQLAREWCLSWGEWAHYNDPGGEKENAAEARLRVAIEAATLRQQAARVDEVEAREVVAAMEDAARRLYVIAETPEDNAASEVLLQAIPVVQAALSAQPAERQGDDGVAEILAALPHCSARTTFTFSRDKLQALLRQAAPVGVPDGLTKTRGYHAMRHAVECLRAEARFVDEEGEDTNAIEDLLDALAAAPSAPKGVDRG